MQNNNWLSIASRVQSQNSRRITIGIPGTGRVMSESKSTGNFVPSHMALASLSDIQPIQNYQISPVSGGAAPIYNFLAPPEQLTGIIATSSDQEKRSMLIYYFTHLYPLSNRHTWERMSDTDLENFYYNLDFWYTFNPSWGVSPMPVTLDPRVVGKWEKNTFYQAGTIIQSAITSICWDLDSAGQKFYYASRLNNAPQVDPSLTYVSKNGSTTIRSVCRDPEFWETVLGNMIEITSWGWSPYPFGIYSQGPLKGTGNFLHVPNNSIIGTSHWDIIHKCKSSQTTDQQIWSAIMNHELTRLTPGKVYMGNGVDCTPMVIKKKGSVYTWSNILDNGTGHTPIIISYSCFIMGGFGGIGDAWQGNYGTFWKSWTDGVPGSTWKAGYYYAPIIEESRDINGNTVYTCPVDQSVPADADLKGFTSGRVSDDMWSCFSYMFKDHIQQWDTNYSIEMWRYPLFASGPNTFTMTGPCVANPCDDFMMAMATGNFDVVHYSPWGFSNLDPSLSKFSKSPMLWRDKIGNFPTGRLSRMGSGYVFVVRAQMPNVNGDICQEFADFRVLIPGELSTGSGDQEEWAKLFKFYSGNYMFTVDPFNRLKYRSFSGDFEPWIPDVKPREVKPKEGWWKHSENVATQKSFYDFDVYSGQWVGWLAYCGIRNGKSIAFEQYPANADSSGVIMLSDSVIDSSGNPVTVSQVCTIPNPLSTIEPISATNVRALGGNLACYENKNYSCPNTSCRNYTFARNGDEYYPFATDAFSTGIVGFQANGWYANIGSSQTRWCLNSKGIAWQFHAPLANRLMLKNGLRVKNESHALKSSGLSTFLLVFLVMIMVISGFITVYSLYTKPNRYELIFIVSLIVFLGAFLIILFSPSSKQKREELQLRVYFTMVYPTVPIKRWQDMSFDQLRKFYCSLHQWYRGEKLPSPVDYMDSPDWEGQPPFHLNSDWKDFTVRKNCIMGAPMARNEYDNSIVIGHDERVGTSYNDTPTGILFRGRQLNACGSGANIQHITFFSPAYNMWVDTYNPITSVNDPGITYWEKANWVEVSSQWGPFPDGAYFDWSQGTGVFMKLGKHMVGYNGQDLVRRFGNEMYASISTYMDSYKSLCFDMWQRTGFDGMTLSPGGTTITNPDTSTICGMYGTFIMTAIQYQQVLAVKKPDQYWGNITNDQLVADGKLFGRISEYIQMEYYDVVNKTWVTTIPTGQGHIPNYPFPLPFFDGSYTGDEQGRPLMNSYALTMPWKYQQFNLSQFYRIAVINAMFLNYEAIPVREMIRKGADYNYVDILKANVGNPLKSPLSWSKGVDLIDYLLTQAYPHPFFSIFPRIVNQMWDGVPLILLNDDEWTSGNPSLSRIQTGALDKIKYVQDLSQNDVQLLAPMNLPQSNGADLEIDHWSSGIGRMLNYDTAARIQHWCGNKSIAYDLEVINFRIIIPGNLISNVLYDNIYEIWKNAFATGLFTLRDPFHPGNQIYSDTYKDIYDGHTSSTSKNATWLPAPWIGYDPGNNLYGWEPEALGTWANIQRLAYCPIAAEEIGFSNSYPEYNKYIMHHFMKVLG